MKWIALAPLVLLLAACGCCTNRDAVEFRQVSYRPTVIATPAVVSTPVYYDPVTVVDDYPIDVTTTTVDYY